MIYYFPLVKINNSEIEQASQTNRFLKVVIEVFSSSFSLWTGLKHGFNVKLILYKIRYNNVTMHLDIVSGSDNPEFFAGGLIPLNPPLYATACSLGIVSLFNLDMIIFFCLLKHIWLQLNLKKCHILTFSRHHSLMLKITLLTMFL